MKDKNRFSALLKHLMAVAKLKNYTLAKELQYDESYISKWVTGSLLPTEKTSGKIFRDISRCVVSSLDKESREQFYSEYQVDRDRDLEDAIYDNLEAEFDYVINLKTATGSEVAPKTSFYPELTLAQFVKKMRHPVLRQVKSLDVIMATDILSLDHHYQSALALLENSPNVNLNQRNYPGVRFSMLINLNVPESNSFKNVQFLDNLIANMANVDFHLYSTSLAQGKMLFTVKDAYAITGMIMDESHCLSVTETEDVKNANALYDKLQSLCNPECLAVRRTTILQMIQDNEYVQYCFSKNLRCVFSHITEHFLPEDLFMQYLEDYCNRHPDADPAKIRNVHKLLSAILQNVKLRLMLDEDGMNDFAVTGCVDFLGDTIHLTPDQRLQCLEYTAELLKKNPNLECRILRDKRAFTRNGVASPTSFLSDSICYTRMRHDNSSFNICAINQTALENMYRKCFDSFWEITQKETASPHSIEEMMQYLIQIVQVQILAGE